MLLLGGEQLAAPHIDLQLFVLYRNNGTFALIWSQLTNEVETNVLKLSPQSDIVNLP